MATGLGFKTFTTGEVLTAGDTNGYLMQGVLVFANAAGRDAAITAPAEGQFAYLKDTDGLFYYSGSAWVASAAAAGGMTVLASGSIGSVASLTLSSISGTYKNLQLNLVGVSKAASFYTNLKINSATNLYGNVWLGWIGAYNQRSNSANAFCPLETNNYGGSNTTISLVLFNYAAVGKKIGSGTFFGDDGSGADAAGLISFGNLNTAAITSLTISATGAGNFTAGTYELIGIK